MADLNPDVNPDITAQPANQPAGQQPEPEVVTPPQPTKYAIREGSFFEVAQKAVRDNYEVTIDEIEVLLHAGGVNADSFGVQTLDSHGQVKKLLDVFGILQSIPHDAKSPGFKTVKNDGGVPYKYRTIKDTTNLEVVFSSPVAMHPGDLRRLVVGDPEPCDLDEDIEGLDKLFQVKVAHTMSTYELSVNVHDVGRGRFAYFYFLGLTIPLTNSLAPDADTVKINWGKYFKDLNGCSDGITIGEPLIKLPSVQTSGADSDHDLLIMVDTASACESAMTSNIEDIVNEVKQLPDKAYDKLLEIYIRLTNEVIQQLDSSAILLIVERLPKNEIKVFMEIGSFMPHYLATMGGTPRGTMALSMIIVREVISNIIVHAVSNDPKLPDIKDIIGRIIAVSGNNIVRDRIKEDTTIKINYAMSVNLKGIKDVMLQVRRDCESERSFDLDKATVSHLKVAGRFVLASMIASNPSRNAATTRPLETGSVLKREIKRLISIAPWEGWVNNDHPGFNKWYQDNNVGGTETKIQMHPPKVPRLPAIVKQIVFATDQSVFSTVHTIVQTKTADVATTVENVTKGVLLQSGRLALDIIAATRKLFMCFIVGLIGGGPTINKNHSLYFDVEDLPDGGRSRVAKAVALNLRQLIAGNAPEMALVTKLLETRLIAFPDITNQTVIETNNMTEDQLWDALSELVRTGIISKHVNGSITIGKIPGESYLSDHGRVMEPKIASTYFGKTGGVHITTKVTINNLTAFLKCITTRESKAADWVKSYNDHIGQDEFDVYLTYTETGQEKSTLHHVPALSFTSQALEADAFDNVSRPRLVNAVMELITHIQLLEGGNRETIMLLWCIVVNLSTFANGVPKEGRTSFGMMYSLGQNVQAGICMKVALYNRERGRLARIQARDQ